MPIDKGALEPGVEPGKAAPPAASEPTDWQAQATEWKKRATGWQAEFQTLQKEKETWGTAKQQLDQEVAQLKQQFGTLEGEKSTLEQQLEEWDTETQRLTTAHEEATARLQKLDMIQEEFPDLFKFSKLIPTTAEAEEQRGTLEQWNTLMSEHIDVEVQKRVELATRGISPPASPARGVSIPSETELAARLSEIAGKTGFEEEYGKLKTLWDGIQPT